MCISLQDPSLDLCALSASARRCLATAWPCVWISCRRSHSGTDIFRELVQLSEDREAQRKDLKTDYNETTLYAKEGFKSSPKRAACQYYK